MRKATALQLERLRNGYSQAQVAEILQVYPYRLSRIERGSAVPTDFERETLCKVYSATAEKLFPESA